MTPHRFRLFARALALAGAMLTSAKLSDFSHLSAADPTAEAIRKAWKDRQSRIRSARVEWQSRHWFDQNVHRERAMRDAGKPIVYGPDGRPALKPAKEQPATVVEGYIETEQQNVLLLDGPQVRFENRGTSIHTSDTIVPFERLHVAKGEVWHQLDLSLTFTPWPECRVVPGEPRTELTDQELWHWAFRPMDHEMLLDTPGVELADRILFKKHEYAVVRRKRRPYVDEIWLDPEQQFAIVQVATQLEGKPRFLQQFEYQHVLPEDLWVPAKWTKEEFNVNTGATYSMVQGQVTRCELNLDVPRGSFELEFAAGTIVNDLREDAEGYDARAKCAQYLVLPDGKKQIFSTKERDAVYEQLMKPAALPR